eukprot:1216148-Pyramimonas_sp.AAC.1
MIPIAPRDPRVAHGACSWESWALATLVTPALWTFVPLVYCTTHLEDASGILHFWSGSEARRAYVLILIKTPESMMW